MLLALSVKAIFVYGAFSVPIYILMWLYLPETERHFTTYSHATHVLSSIRKYNNKRHVT
jgi:hypothetical protein